MAEPLTVETAMGIFRVTQSSPTSGRLLSNRALIEGRVYAIDTRWNLREPAHVLVISSLGFNTRGTAAQAARGNWTPGAVRAVQTVLEPHILSYVQEGTADAPTR